MNALKNFVIVIVAAVVTISGCSKVENLSLQNQSDNQISFATYTGRAVTKTGTALGQSFNVEGYISGNPSVRYFQSTTYRYSNGNYVGETNRYWPVSYDSLDFYAVSPLQYTNTSGTAVDLKPVDSTFTVTGTNGRTDIVAARLVNQEFVDPVTLIFGHKLTKVAFKAVGFDATKTFKIAKITVEANSSAKYSYGADSWIDSTSTDTHEYTFFDDEMIIPVSTTTPVAVSDTLFLIPSQAATVKAKISYSIYDGPVRIDTTASPVEVNLPVSGVWGINKSVIYKLTLNISSSKKPINFSAEYQDWDADTTVNVPPLHYVEEGVDYGEGIKIGNTVWAPVNCGYDATYYKYGRFYQWGRKYGRGYQATDSTSVFNDAGDILQTIVPGPVSVSNEQSDQFYSVSGSGNEPYDWALENHANDTRWNVGTESNPVKTIFDPCPTGWRVPTLTEIKALMGTNTAPVSVSGTHGSSTVNGVRFDGGDGSSSSNSIFLPLSGELRTDGSACKRNTYGSYWCSVMYDSSGYHRSRIMIFRNGSASDSSCARAYGCTVRCVAD